jgi:quercetin dioxygenase-like cupin family protein
MSFAQRLQNNTGPEMTVVSYGVALCAKFDACNPIYKSLMIKKINWEDVPSEEVTPSMHRKIVSGEKLMIAKIKMKDGFLVPLHHHVHEQITQVVSGQMRFWFGVNKEEVMDLYPGDVVVIPSNLPHEALMIGDVEEIDTWAPPRQDWLDKTDDYLRK